MRRLITAAMLAAGTGLVAAAPVAAECEGPVPSFRKAAATARTIFVGNVTVLHPSSWDGDDGRSTRFTLRVRWALRGAATSSVEIRDLDPIGCNSYIRARAGDRIAFALHATGTRTPQVYSTVAWVQGVPPEMVGLESISLSEVFELARRGAPDTATTVTGPEPPHPAGPLVAVFVATLLVAGARFGRKLENAPARDTNLP